VKPWIIYTLIRVGIFAAVFAVLYGLLSFEPWVAAGNAAVIGLATSYLFFRRQRDAAVGSIGREKTPTADEQAE
jgi:hypothetical protein